MDQNGTRYLVVPETDQPMDDYYAALQDACDAGERPDLLDPVAVALDFEEDWSGGICPPRFVLEVQAISRSSSTCLWPRWSWRTESAVKRPGQQLPAKNPGARPE